MEHAIGPNYHYTGPQIGPNYSPVEHGGIHGELLLEAGVHREGHVTCGVEVPQRVGPPRITAQERAARDGRGDLPIQ